MAGAWMVNFNNAPILWLVPALGVVLPLLTILTSRMEKGLGIRLLFTDVSLHHPDCRYRNVPVCDAIQHHDERKFDHVGCNVQPADAESDDVCSLCVRTDHSAVHRLVLLEDVWSHH